MVSRIRLEKKSYNIPTHPNSHKDALATFHTYTYSSSPFCAHGDIQLSFAKSRWGKKIHILMAISFITFHMGSTQSGFGVESKSKN